MRNLLKTIIPLPIRNLRRLRYRDLTDIPIQLRYRIKYIKTRKSGTLYFYPYLPNSVRAAIFKICCVNGWKMKEARPNSSPVIFWPDREASFKSTVPGAINGKCLNIDKDFISDCFESVFGYNLIVDPQKADISYVRKSLKNAAHDGIVLSGPTKKLEGFVYQKLINNLLDNGDVEDLRIIYINDILPKFYRKIRPASRRFQNINSEVHLEETKDFFSEKEKEMLVNLCRIIGLDYGELDVLRDRGDKRIYVVDVNRAPFGPPRGISQSAEDEAVKMMSEYFSKALRELG